MQIAQDTGRKIVRLVLLLFALLLLLWGYTLWQSYKGRVDLVHSERVGCERGKKDRKANAIGWRAAEFARLDTLAQTLHISFKEAKARLDTKPTPREVPDLVAARQYAKIASGLERRGRIDCTKAYPNASFLP